MPKISCTIDDGLALLRIDDGKANAMNFDFFEGLNEALDTATAAKARALVIQGRGPFFSGGLDLKLVPSLSADELRRLATEMASAVLRVWGLGIPTVAALEGHAVGGGAILAFACDGRVARNGPGQLYLSEVAIGIPLPTWAMIVSQSVIALPYQTRIILHASPIPWEEALEIGLVDTLLASTEDLSAAARAAAQKLAVIDRNAYAVTKSRLRQAHIDAALRSLETDFADQIP